MRPLPAQPAASARTVEPTRHVIAGRAAAFERDLTAAALGGAGWDQLLAEVRRATGRHCRLVAPDGTVLAATDDGAGLIAGSGLKAADGRGVVTRDGWRARAIAAAAGGRSIGLLLIAEPASTDALDLLRAAVTGVLIESLRRDAHPTFADGAAVVAALRVGTGDSGPALSAAAARFGLRLDRPGCGAVLAHIGSRHRAWASALGWLDRPVDRVGCLAYLVVTDAADLAGVQKRLELAVGDATVRASCGAAVLDPAGYRNSFGEADRLLATARIGGVPPTGFDDAGVLQVLLATPAPRLRWFVERHLGPVLKRPELLATLRAWLAASGSRQLVSEELHLHRNSVGYRVGKLKALLGVDPLRPDHAAVLHTALAAHDLLLGDATFQDAESRAHHADEEPSG
jgi:hypothetical protein